MNKFFFLLIILEYTKEYYYSCHKEIPDYNLNDYTFTGMVKNYNFNNNYLIL